MLRVSEIQLFNLIYHYEQALFGVLAPFLAPLFFPDLDYVTSLALYFAPYSLVAKPAGALFWGWLGDRFCRFRATYWALAGMAVMTIIVGLLPPFKLIGWLAPAVFIAIRIVRGFFSSGASTGAPLILLEAQDRKRRSRLSSQYEVAGMSGIFLASFLALIFSLLGYLNQAWRALFLLGGLLALIQLWRVRGRVADAHFEEEPSPSDIIGTLRGIAAIACVTGFSYANYNLVMLLMHSYLPKVVELSHATVQALHLGFIALDIVLLPLFGSLAQRIGKERMMFGVLVLFSGFLLALMAFGTPLTLATILVTRFGMLCFGVAVAAPYHFWTLDQLSAGVRFRGVAIGKVAGKELFGAPAVSISLLLMSRFGHDSALFLYVLALVVLAAGSIAVQHAKSRPVPA